MIEEFDKCILRMKGKEIMDTPILDMIREYAAKRIWSVYVLVNESRREIYLGVSKHPRERILDEHASGETKTIAHWTGDDDISVDILYTGLDRFSASRTAHTLEKLIGVLTDEYKVFQTTGI